jgi:hypothetical protein
MKNPSPDSALVQRAGFEVKRTREPANDQIVLAVALEHKATFLLNNRVPAVFQQFKHGCTRIRLWLKTCRMPRGRPVSKFEEMPAHPGFRATIQQHHWLEAARLAAEETSLSEWLRKIAITEGERLLGTPFPRRRVISEQPQKQKPRTR